MMPHPFSDEKPAAADLTLRQAQAMVDNWIRTYGVRYFSELTNMAVLTEEVGELREAVESGRPAGAPHGVAEEVGDVLFMAAKVARDHGIDPEEALHHSCDKFARRFRSVEEQAGDRPLDGLTEAELLSLWDRAKKSES